MEKANSAVREQVTKQITFRISEPLYEKTKLASEEIGSSHNSFLLMLVSMGLKAYNGKYIIHQKEQ